MRHRFHRALALHAPHGHRFIETLESLPAEVQAAKARAEQLVRAGRDDHLARQGHRLQARCQVGRAADDGLFTRRARADDFAHHHRARGNAHAQPQPHATGQRLQGRHGGHQFQPGARGAPGVVFMRLRVAEEREDAVAHVAVDEAPVARDDAACGGLEGAQDDAQFLDVQRVGQRGGIGEVAEHDGDLAPLGFGTRCVGLQGGRGQRGIGGVLLPDQHHTVFLAGHALAQDQLLLEVGQALVVQPELALQSGAGEALLAAQQFNCGVQNLLEGHGR